MNTRLVKTLVTWNVVLTTLFLVTLAVAAVSAQAANDPPVEIYTASLKHPVSGTGAADSGSTITNTSFQNFLTLNVNFSGTHNHACIVTASANVKNPASGATGFTYYFNVAADAAYGSYSYMIVEFGDNAGVNDPSYWPVTTTKVFTGLAPGPHQLHFAARRGSGSSPNLEINNASLTAVCFKKIQNAPVNPDTGDAGTTGESEVEIETDQ